MPPKYKFQDGEKVLCFHGPLIYEAKCLECEVKDKQVRYYVHYAGWNKNWDEWVPENRVLKYNEANVQKQKELQKAHKANPQKAKKTVKPRKSEGGKDGDSRASTPTERSILKTRGSSVTPSTSQDTPTEVPRKKRVRLETTVENEEQFSSKVEVRIKIPEELKPWLANDWDHVIYQKKLVNLPAKVTIDEIINKYIKSASSRKNVYNVSALIETANGIREYFNVMLGTQLLYEFERPQYAQILRDRTDTPISKVYSAIHLLRLFTKLGSMLSYTILDEKRIQFLLSNIHDFLRYFRDNFDNFFSLQDYNEAPPDYHKRIIV